MNVHEKYKKHLFNYFWYIVFDLTGMYLRSYMLAQTPQTL